MPTPYSPSGGSVMPCLRHLLAEEPVRNLDQDAGAVAGQRVGADRAAVGQVLQDLQALLDDGVALRALDVRDEADAAGVVFVGRVVETLLAGSVGMAVDGRHLAHGRTWQRVAPAGSTMTGGSFTAEPAKYTRDGPRRPQALSRQCGNARAPGAWSARGQAVTADQAACCVAAAPRRRVRRARRPRMTAVADAARAG